jgi:hypothetical protein
VQKKVVRSEQGVQRKGGGAGFDDWVSGGPDPLQNEGGSGGPMTSRSSNPGGGGICVGGAGVYRFFWPFGCVMGKIEQ